MTDKFYILDCDRCEKQLGWTTNGAFPSMGLTLCPECMAPSRRRTLRPSVGGTTPRQEARNG